jgi:hypothetical protein
LKLQAGKSEAAEVSRLRYGEGRGKEILDMGRKMRKIG